jgi:hypothetical protein
LPVVQADNLPQHQHYRLADPSEVNYNGEPQDFEAFLSRHNAAVTGTTSEPVAAATPTAGPVAAATPTAEPVAAATPTTGPVIAPGAAAATVRSAAAAATDGLLADAATPTANGRRTMRRDVE